MEWRRGLPSDPPHMLFYLVVLTVGGVVVVLGTALVAPAAVGSNAVSVLQVLQYYVLLFGPLTLATNRGTFPVLRDALFGGEASSRGNTGALLAEGAAAVIGAIAFVGLLLFTELGGGSTGTAGLMTAGSDATLGGALGVEPTPLYNGPTAFALVWAATVAYLVGYLLR